MASTPDPDFDFRRTERGDRVILRVSAETNCKARQLFRDLSLSNEAFERLREKVNAVPARGASS